MKKKRIIAAVLTALPAVFALCLCFYFSQNAINQLPNTTQLNFNLASNEAPLTIADIESLSEKISMKKVSFCAELTETQIKEQAVTPTLTNESFFEVQGVTLEGEGITKETVEKGEKIAVISDTLALRLFFNTDAIGKTLMLNGEEYKIRGIYREEKNLINNISSDGKQRIYIPYTCTKNYGACKAQTITYDNTAPSAPLFEQMNLYQYYTTNFSEKAKVIKNFEHIIYLILFIIFCFITLKIWYWICKKLIKNIKESLKEKYFLDSLKSMPLKYILLLITATGIPAVLLIIFFLSDFSIFIISKYIPYDNIFDVSYYLNAIIENAHMSNSVSLTGDTNLIKLYSNTFGITFWLVILFFLTSVITVKIIGREIKNIH